MSSTAQVISLEGLRSIQRTLKVRDGPMSGHTWAPARVCFPEVKGGGYPVSAGMRDFFAHSTGSSPWERRNRGGLGILSWCDTGSRADSGIFAFFCDDWREVRGTAGAVEHRAQIIFFCIGRHPRHSSSLCSRGRSHDGGH
ncbi:hypothetical protein KSP40_PGU019387 [Platanthera guangdongensis]|uniref:Uncharacterized protein n=1 Tax=Platanthera guangdongensis TaxID=2320717 RepID=A0ABR2N290_9ASPA